MGSLILGLFLIEGILQIIRAKIDYELKLIMCEFTYNMYEQDSFNNGF